MLRRRTGTTLAALAVGSALLLAGCGAGSTTSDAATTPAVAAAVAPKAAIEQAVSRTGEVTSSAFTATITAAGQTMTMTGRTGGSGPDRRAVLVTEAAGKRFETRLIGTTVYVSLAGLGLPGAAGKSWLTLDTSATKALAALGLGSITDGSDGTDPRRLLEMLQASGDLVEVGAEDVDGTATTHYRGRLELPAGLDQLPPQTRKAVADKLVAAGVTGMDIDAWIDAAGLPVTVRQAMGSTAGDIVTVVRFTGYGEPVDVTAPPASETVDAAALLGG